MPLVLGVLMMAGFVVWELKGAKYPMFPSRLKQEPRILALTLVITFISGANFFSILMFWPTQAFNVYGQDPIGVGIRGIPVGFSILAGACIVLWLLSVLRGHNKELLIVSSVLMTAGKPSLIPWAQALFREMNQLQLLTIYQDVDPLLLLELTTSISYGVYWCWLDLALAVLLSQPRS